MSFFVPAEAANADLPDQGIAGAHVLATEEVALDDINLRALVQKRRNFLSLRSCIIISWHFFL